MRWEVPNSGCESFGMAIKYPNKDMDQEADGSRVQAAIWPANTNIHSSGSPGIPFEQKELPDNAA